MTDPEIKAALHAAGQAAMDAGQRDYADRHFGGKAPPRLHAQTVRTVAAFLRHMDHVPLGNGFTFVALAAAVEAAADER